MASLRASSASTASRMNIAMRLGPTSASMRERTSSVNLTMVGLVSNLVLSGGRPIRGLVPESAEIVNFLSHNRNRLLTGITDCGYNFNTN